MEAKRMNAGLVAGSRLLGGVGRVRSDDGR